MVLSPETVIAICAVGIALLALFVSIWQGAVSRRHSRLSVKPHLRIDWTIDGESPQERVIVVLSNSGLGPAVIGGFTWVLDGEPVAGSADSVPDRIANRLELWDCDLRSFSPYAGDAMSPGERHRILEATASPLRDCDYLARALGRVSIDIDYASMYEERARFTAPLGLPPNKALRPTAEPPSIK